MSDLTDSSEMFQSGLVHSVSEPISIPTTCTFELPLDSNEFEEEDKPPGILPYCPLLLPENVQWRPEFTSEQLHHIKETERCAFEQNFDFCVRLSPPSDYDWEEQFDPPVSATLSEFLAESSDGQQANSLPLYLIHENPWLTSTNTWHLWPHTRHQICCNVISKVPTVMLGPYEFK